MDTGPAFVEIDSGIERADGTATLRVIVREADGLRRTLATFGLSDEKAINLVRGDAFVTTGGRPGGPMDDLTALVGALDVLTSPDAEPTGRSPREIADDLLTDLGLGPGQVRSGVTADRRVRAVTRVLRSRVARATSGSEETG